MNRLVGFIAAMLIVGIPSGSAIAGDTKLPWVQPRAPSPTMPGPGAPSLSSPGSGVYIQTPPLPPQPATAAPAQAATPTPKPQQPGSTNK